MSLIDTECTIIDSPSDVWNYAQLEFEKFHRKVQRGLAFGVFWRKKNSVAERNERWANGVKILWQIRFSKQNRNCDSWTRDIEGDFRIGFLTQLASSNFKLIPRVSSPWILYFKIWLLFSEITFHNSFSYLKLQQVTLFPFLFSAIPSKT